MFSRQVERQVAEFAPEKSQYAASSTAIFDGLPEHGNHLIAEICPEFLRVESQNLAVEPVKNLGQCAHVGARFSSWMGADAW